MKLRAEIIPLFLAISLGLGGPCSPDTETTLAKPKPNDTITEVETTQARFEQRSITLEREGVFSPSEQATVRSEIAGSVEKTYVSEGNKVNAGDPLITFKSDEISLRLERKQAEIRESEAALQLAQNMVQKIQAQKNQTPFFDEETSPPPPSNPTDPNMDWPAKASLEQAKLERLNKELEEIEMAVKKLTVTSPIAGMISQKLVNEGSYVEISSPLFEVVNLNPMSVSFTLPSEYSMALDRASPVDVTPENETNAPPLRGDVYFVGAQVNGEDGSLEVRAHISNETGLLRGGIKGKVSIPTQKTEPFLIVPQKTLISEGEKKFVYVISGYKAKKIEVVRSFPAGPNQLAIKANMRIDDPLILSPVAIQDGGFVKVLVKP